MENIEYIHTQDVHNTRAAENFLPFLFKFIVPNSVIDIGCGLGTWLRVFKNFGVKRILGVDGDHVNFDLLEIDRSEFVAHDLRTPLKVNERFDLAVCLEVAEHLPEEYADVLVDTLTSSADTILFSAALELQGGQNHINEQSFDYWIKKFNQKGYVFKDVFRNELWKVDAIDWWYRQNAFLVVKENAPQNAILDYYHPDKVKDTEVFVSKLRSMINELELRNAELERSDRNFRTGYIPLTQAFSILGKAIKRVITRSK